MNKALLIGRVGKDPETKTLDSGQMICRFTLATNEHYKDRSGEKVQKTEWHRIVAWGKAAEICGNYLVKGELVYIEGKIQTRSWEDKEGVKHSTTEIIVSSLEMLGGSQSGGGSRTDDVPF